MGEKKMGKHTVYRNTHKQKPRNIQQKNKNKTKQNYIKACITIPTEDNTDKEREAAKTTEYWRREPQIVSGYQKLTCAHFILGELLLCQIVTNTLIIQIPCVLPIK